MEKAMSREEDALIIVVIIPTYNEKDNIEKMIPVLFHEIFSNMEAKMHLLVVDDNSPDGTQSVIIGFQKKYRNLHLLTGPKAGLGKAYIRGMTYALNPLNADVIIEMDADFSHDPKDIPRLITELRNYDFVIGSRYVPGGKIPTEWAYYRRMNSKFGNFAARFIAGMYHIKDCTAGFRAIKADLLKRITLEGLNVKGYCFQINLLHEAFVNGAKIKEIPVIFKDRTIGASKLGIKDIIEFLWAVWIIRLESSKTFLRFCIVGLSGLFVNLGTLTYLLSIGVNKFLASPLSIEISIITNFLLNNYWTFGNRKTGTHISIKGLRFNIISFFSLGISFGTFVSLSFFFPGYRPQIIQAIGIIPAMLTNYLLNSYWTFKGKKNE